MWLYVLNVTLLSHLGEWQVLSIHCRTELALSVETEHRAVARVDFIAKSSSVDMVDGAVRASVTVTILPVSSSQPVTDADTVTDVTPYYTIPQMQSPSVL